MTTNHPFNFSNPDFQTLFDHFADYRAKVDEYNQVDSQPATLAKTEQLAKIKASALAAQEKYADLRSKIEAIYTVYPIPQVIDPDRSASYVVDIEILKNGRVCSVAKRSGLYGKGGYDPAKINWSALGEQPQAVAKRMVEALNMALEIAATLDANGKLNPEDNMYQYQLIYQIGDGLFTIQDTYEWIMNEWDIIRTFHPNARLVSFEMI